MMFMLLRQHKSNEMEIYVLPVVYGLILELQLRAVPLNTVRIIMPEEQT